MSEKTVAEIIEKTVKELPHKPGVYRFLDENGMVLYVGKATSLRSRVQQYFSGQEEKSRGPRMRQLVEATTEIITIQTDSVLEALVLEAELIKRHRPKYNIDGKDDKSYSYFVITKEEFPRVLILRQTDFEKEMYQAREYKRGNTFGPYTSQEQMRTALKIIRKIFPFHARAEHSEKGCLSYQIGLCPGPYDDAISRTEYMRNIRNISLFLSGKKKKILTELEKEMMEHAEQESYEEAGRVKKQIYALTHINDIALMSRRDSLLPHIDGVGARVECFDISHIGGQYVVASMVVFVGGLPHKQAYRKFKIKAVKGINDVGAMREVLARRLNHLRDWGKPDVLVLDGGQGHLNMGQELLTHLELSDIGLLAVAKGPTRKKVDVYESSSFPVVPEIKDDRDLLESAREEAHRFAIAYHKQLRAKGYIG